MALPLLTLTLYLGGGDAAAFVVEHAHTTSPPRRALHPQVREPTLPLFVASTGTSSSTSASADSDTRKEMALQLMVENAMPSLDLDDPLHGESELPSLGHYDEDHATPLESEFVNMMSTFLTYSERDIQSLTTTSNRYMHYDTQHEQHDANQRKNRKRPHQRTKEEAIRYRALYAGVQAASNEPEVLRSFTVLFEDYLPIRLAGRKIFKHLNNVMAEVQRERRGEISRAGELCPSWTEDTIESAREVWDTLMDEGLLLEHSLESVAEEEQSQEGGVISLPQLMDLGIDRVLIDEGLVRDSAQLEHVVRQCALDEELHLEEHYNQKRHHAHEQSEGKYLEMTFPTFMRVLHQCSLRTHVDVDIIPNLMKNIQGKALEHRLGNNQDTSLLLAEKAIHSGSTNACKKRQKYSNRYDEYVSTFKLWESKFLGKDDIEGHPSRRVEILKGCFFGARNKQVLSALKIVYLDYRALRLAGDLIFKLMSTIAN